MASTASLQRLISALINVTHITIFTLLEQNAVFVFVLRCHPEPMPISLSDIVISIPAKVDLSLRRPRVSVICCVPIIQFSLSKVSIVDQLLTSKLCNFWVTLLGSDGF